MSCCRPFSSISTASSPTASRSTCAPTKQVLQRDGIELTRTDYYARYLGYDDVGLFEALARDRRHCADRGDRSTAGWPPNRASWKRCCPSDSVLFPGAAACVKMFAERVPLAVASGALEPEIAIVLEHAGLRGCFAAIASASDGVRGKPAPDLYLLAIAKLARSPEAWRSTPPHASRSRIRDGASKRPAGAGLRCVAVTHTYPAAELGKRRPDRRSLRDLTPSKIEELMRDNGRAAMKDTFISEFSQAGRQPRSRPRDARADDCAGSNARRSIPPPTSRSSTPWAPLRANG